MSNRYDDLMKFVLQNPEVEGATDFAQYLAIQHGAAVPGGRPPLPKEMLGLTCAQNPDDLLSIGAYKSESGFDSEGYMHIMVSNSERPYGGVSIDRDQARQLRDFLSAKLGD